MDAWRTQALVGYIHITHHDGDVLEPPIPELAPLWEPGIGEMCNRL